jgi:hypothetical protein
MLVPTLSKPTRSTRSASPWQITTWSPFATSSTLLLLALLASVWTLPWLPIQGACEPKTWFLAFLKFCGCLFSKPRFVAGAMGPTNRTAAVAAGENEDLRNVNFEQLRVAYSEQARGLIDGGCHLLLVEVRQSVNAC